MNSNKTLHQSIEVIVSKVG